MVEEFKGPNKAKELFEAGEGKFKCKACEESFARKKVYDKHCKTAVHKSQAKMFAEKLKAIKENSTINQEMLKE